MYVQLEEGWTDGDGNTHEAGDTVDVDAATLAELQANGVAADPDSDRAVSRGGATGGEGGDSWAGPTDGEGSDSWAGPTDGEGSDSWAGPTGGDKAG